ncbi:MAG: DUF169 domain-containing protein [Firmicutes bacterium]|jgi:uncharacterized protein (DUF169 family)|nr:DUF169 domain-containing protein [Bacillota bacterium]MDD4337429.1 DUF169 domain-containing protein [Bacillota bacterium]MDD4793365.1 DUF169 domain-containing protein [Bacillota bacterium]
MEKKQLAVELDRILRLDTKPVGIKLYKSQDDLPRKPFNFKLNLCQLVAMARYQGKTNTGTPDKMICAMGAACVGLIDTPEAIASGKAAVGAYVKDQTAGKAFMDNTFKIGDTGKKYDGILAGALESMEEDPDVVVMYVNPAQAMRLIHACTYDTGEKITADTVAEAALCSCIGYAVANDKPVVGFPCAGDRIFGGTQTHEVVFVAPYALVKEKLIGNLERTAQGGFSVYPVPPNMFWTPTMPPTYTIQPEDISK